LITGDWEASFNSIFLIQTKTVMQRHPGSPILLLCAAHYFMQFYSHHNVLSGYFIFLVSGLYFSSSGLPLRSVNPGSDHFPAPPHLSLLKSHFSSVAPAILLGFVHSAPLTFTHISTTSFFTDEWVSCFFSEEQLRTRFCNRTTAVDELFFPSE